MAQEIITLAKEETSQEILSKVNALKSAVDSLKTVTTAISDAQKIGGGRIRKYYKFTGLTSSGSGAATLRIRGKGSIAFFASSSSGSSFTLDKIDDCSANVVFVVASSQRFVTVEFLSMIDLTAGGMQSNNPCFFYIDWEESVGTVTTTNTNTVLTSY